jgi:hypothetical protein
MNYGAIVYKRGPYRIYMTPNDEFIVARRRWFGLRQPTLLWWGNYFDGAMRYIDQLTAD